MEVFVARQPIFDTKKNVFAYELLFRSGLENFCDQSLETDRVSSQTISTSVLVIGLETLTKSKRAFINFSQNLLIDGTPMLFDKNSIVVEVLETVEPTEEVIEACRKLKAAGYTLALDDFIYTNDIRPLVELADIIKVDFLQTRGAERREVIEQIGRPEIQYLAEKVETIEDFKEAVDLGYEFFQGYFFSKPVIVQGADIPVNKLNLMRIVHEVNRPDLGFENIENIVKHDVSMSYKLLRFINSAFFGFSAKIESIRHALIMLGTREIRKWVSLLALSGLSYDKPQELMNVSVLRARFGEGLAKSIGRQSRSDDFFLMGMFSLIDALLDQPLQEILKELPVEDDIKSALTGQDTENEFYNILQLMIAYEKGSWEDVSGYAERMSLQEENLPDIYFKSVEWTNRAL